MPSSDILLRSKIKRGKQLIAAKRFEEAHAVYEQICSKSRNDAESWLTLGAINGMLKRYEDAVACCTRAAELAPKSAVAWYNLGVAFRDTGSTGKAAEALRKALSINPQHQDTATSLGHILVALHRYDEAEEVFRGVLKYQQANSEFYAVYGSAMQAMGRHETAIKAYRKAIRMQHPETSRVYENMAVSLCLQGKYQESIDAFDAALRLDPDNAHTHSNLLMTLHYLSGQDAGNLLEQHRRWPGNKLHPAARVAPVIRAGCQDRVRIGYVSSDFRRHSVAYFVEPLLAHHDANRFEITCYFSHKDGDITTQRLKGLAHRWRNIAEMDDRQLLQQIADDRIDILVDLNGHTSGNRLSAFAQRAAPVQVSCIGYPNTTGVGEMDYRFSDTVADPPGAERYSTETLVRLPGCFLCYRPQVNSPDVAPLPYESNEFITFGSFNNLAKVNPQVISVWVHLLQEIPGSRLVLKNPSLTDQSTRDRYQTIFTDRGISEDRLQLIGFVADDSSHLAAYNLIDIALDTFPYNGTTTICEALWMGVPVITLRGDRHSARVGASLLTAAGSPEWIAGNTQEYIQIAHNLARDTDALASIRSSLREQLCESELCSAKTYVNSVEAAYEKMILVSNQSSK